MPLTRWTVRADPSRRGAARGWPHGGFSGASVSVPNVIEARAFKGASGMRNYEGSVAWYRTSFQAPHAGLYAVRFQSANFKADVWIDGHAAVSHRGSYLPFEARRILGAGTHAVVVRIDWRDPAGQARQGFLRFADLVGDAHRLIADCPCESGCPSCVQSPKCGNLNEPLHKAGALELMATMLGR